MLDLLLEDFEIRLGLPDAGEALGRISGEAQTPTFGDLARDVAAPAREFLELFARVGRASRLVRTALRMRCMPVRPPARNASISSTSACAWAKRSLCSRPRHRMTIESSSGGTSSSGAARLGASGCSCRTRRRISCGEPLPCGGRSVKSS
jgi:hypothetical protein